MRDFLEMKGLSPSAQKSMVLTDRINGRRYFAEPMRRHGISKVDQDIGLPEGVSLNLAIIPVQSVAAFVTEMLHGRLISVTLKGNQAMTNYFHRDCFDARGFLSAAATLIALGLPPTILTGCSSLSRPELPELTPLTETVSAEPRIRFMGTTTLLFEDGRDSILIDGFFSRPGFPGLVFASPDKSRIETALKRAGIEHVEALFVAHSHHDHAMDAGYLSERLNTRVIGSASTGNIVQGCRADNLRFEKIVEERPYEFGAFMVKAFRTPHSHNSPFVGTIRKPLCGLNPIVRYREGGNYSYLITHGTQTVLVVPSAHPTDAFVGIKADIVFLSVGGIGREDEAIADYYWRSVVGATGAKRVVLIHWDDFTRSLDKPLLPPRAFADRPDKVILRLKTLAKNDSVTLYIPQAYATIGLHPDPIRQ